jgi:RNA polymerase sigma-70 factor, ECF subfamily
MTLEIDSVDLEFSNADLWNRLQQGQSDALGMIYDRNSGLVYGIALKMLKNPEDAEDLTHEIFLKLAQTRYDPARGSLRTFLAVLTRSRAIDRLRRSQRSQASLNKWQVDLTAVSPLPELPYREDLKPVVQQALTTLSQEQRQVLDLAYREGLTQMEIADRLQVPLGTIKSWSRRGLIKLRESLQRNGQEES